MGSALKKQKVGLKGLIRISKPSKSTEENRARKATVEVEGDGSSSEEEADTQGNLDDIESDDLNEDDDVDVEDISSDEASSADESEGEDESEDESDEENIPKLKKKKNLDDGSESFSNAFSAIIGSRLKAYDRNDPILARNKTTLKKLESDKLEAKAKKLLLSEKKQLHDKHRVKNLLPSADEPEKVRDLIGHEKKLKKVAQRGVVRLFNAVLSTQIKTNQQISGEKVGQTQKEELMNEISKEKFLDLVQAAGQV